MKAEKIQISITPRQFGYIAAVAAAAGYDVTTYLRVHTISQQTAISRSPASPAPAPSTTPSPYPAPAPAPAPAGTAGMFDHITD